MKISYSWGPHVGSRIQNAMTRAMQRYREVCDMEFVRRDRAQFTITRAEELHAKYKTWWWYDPKLKRLNTSLHFDRKNDYRLCLHELGHVLGLQHTPDKTSIMRATILVEDLSDQDIATLKQKYGERK